MKKYLIIIIAGIILTLSLYSIRFSSFNNQTDIVSTHDSNIVLITIDTLRADHLSCYGYERNTSPNIDKIAKEGIRFTNAIATSSWTSPSMASIMTSLYPISHGVRRGFVKAGKAYEQEALNDGFHTLAEILRNNGYTTFGAVANVLMAEEQGFAQGFDYYHCEGFEEAAVINNVIFSWKGKIKKSKKFFIWIHYIDPHDEYRARSPWISDYAAELWIGNTHLSKQTMEELRKSTPTIKKKENMLEYLIALYDSEINYLDYHIGNLIYKLGLDKNSLIVITSDHGEEFLCHGSLGHGNSLYQELIHVPLIIKQPPSYKKPIISVIDEPASIIDIMPTILGVLGITPSKKIMGKNLLEKEEWSRGQKRDYLFSEISQWYVFNAILKNNWKYIYNTCKQEEELYDITKDHEESDNLVHQEVSIAKELRKELLNWASTSPKAPSTKKKTKPSKEIEEKLKALGYISNGEQKKPKLPPGSCNLAVCHSLTN